MTEERKRTGAHDPSAACLKVRCLHPILLGLASGVLGCNGGHDFGGPAEPVAHAVAPLSIGQLGRHDTYLVWERLAGSAANEVLSGDAFASSFASGTLNDDPIADLVVGAPSDDASGAANTGAVFIFAGAPGGAHTGTRRRQSDAGDGNQADARLGWSVAVGDFNQDGNMDVAAGAPGQPKNGNLNVGKIYVWYGEDADVHNWTGAGTSFWSSQLDCGADESGDEFGYALAAGDFNGDGAADLAIGGPGENSGRGVVCVALGKQGVGLTAGSYYFQDRYSSQDLVAGDRHGQALAAGDLTGDSIAELVIGAPGEDGGRGLALVFRGLSGGTAASTFSSAQTLTQGAAGDPQPNERFGSALAIGNFNATGPRDVAVGAPFDLRSGKRSGLVCTFAGGSTLGGPVCLDQNNVSGAGNEEGDEFGSALAAGDFDRDGDDDLAVGLPGDGAGSEPATSGVVALFEGGSSGLGSGTWFNQEDTEGNSESGDRFGATLAAGDLDGDGAPDLVIGAPGEGVSSYPSGSGLAFVVPGRAPNLLLTHGPIIGAVTETTARIWVRTNRPASVRVTASCAGCAASQAVATLGNATDATGVVSLSGLTPGQTYGYAVSLAPSGSSQFTQVRTGTLKTLAPSGTFTFAVGADLKEGHTPYSIFGPLSARAPDVFFAIGDNVYADVAFDNKESFEGYYKRNYADPSFASFMSRTSTQMIWDDHDIYNNWSCDGPYPVCQRTNRYVAARAAFDEYAGALNPPTPFSLACTLPADDDCEQHAPIYYQYSAQQVDFFVLDTRSYRRKSEQQMLGATQLAALKHWLKTSGGLFKVILSSVPFHQYSTTGDDSWDGSGANCIPVGQYRSEMDEIFDFIDAKNVLGVVLVSGDQHWAGMFEHQVDGVVKVHEFMPTPLGTSSRPVKCPAPSPAVTVTGGRYFGLFKVTPGPTPTLQYNLIDDTNTSVHCKIIDRAGSLASRRCQ